MPEPIAILGSVGAVCSLIAGIAKTIDVVNDLRTRWEDADLTLLSLASQLVALRAASTKIQEWIDLGLHDAHHQLVMDLDISITCCSLLINKVESFFTNLACLIEKPLDLRHKFKVVFGSAGPESVQKLLERQTNALTLLLTACNCNTLSEQQKHLEATKSRKVLNRAKADSVSLCVQRDTTSLTSKLTDNLSKISRVFDFDSNVFSTGVYERAFRGSVKNALRKQQSYISEPSPEVSRKNIYLLGEDEVGKELFINALHIASPKEYPVAQWMTNRSHMQQLCLELMSNIIKRGTPDWDMEYVSILNAYSLGPHEQRPQFEEAVNACAQMWSSAVRLVHEPDPDAQGYLREEIKFHKMIFHVDIIPAGGLNLYCGNSLARCFMDRMERVLPIRLTDPRYSMPLPSDHLRAVAASSSSGSYDFPFESHGLKVSIKGSSAHHATLWPSFQALQSALALVFIFDMCDYGHGGSGRYDELSTRLEATFKNLAMLNNPDPPHDLPFLLFLNNVERLKKQLDGFAYTLVDGTKTRNYTTVVAEIGSRFAKSMQLRCTAYILDLDLEKEPTYLLAVLKQLANSRNAPVSATPVERVNAHKAGKIDSSYPLHSAEKSLVIDKHSKRKTTNPFVKTQPQEAIR